MDHIRRICDQGNNRTETQWATSCISSNVRLLYFPINLGQLSPLDKYRIPDPSNLYDRLKKIPTNFTISDEDDLLLGQAAELIMTADQQPHGWAPRALTRDELQSPGTSAATSILSDEEHNDCNSLLHVIHPDLNRLDEAFAFYVLCTAKGAYQGNREAPSRLP